MLSGKTAVVTGASRGIGRAIAEKLAAEGAFVVINYNGSKEAAETVLAGIRAAGGDGCVMPALLTRISIFPYKARISFIHASHAAKSIFWSTTRASQRTAF